MLTRVPRFRTRSLPIHPRWLSSTSDDQNPKPSEPATPPTVIATPLGRWGKLQQYAQSALTAGGTGLVLYCGWEATSFVSNLTLMNAANYGFTAGFVTAFGMCGVAFGASRLYTLNAEQAYKHAMKAVKHDREVIAELGGPLNPGSFRAYSFDNSNITMEGFRPRLKPRQLQILFQISGPRGHGMVSAEIVKKDGSMLFNSLVVDLLDSGRRVVLCGDPKSAVYQGHIRFR